MDHRNKSYNNSFNKKTLLRFTRAKLKKNYLRQLANTNYGSINLCHAAITDACVMHSVMIADRPDVAAMAKANTPSSLGGYDFGNHAK